MDKIAPKKYIIGTVIFAISLILATLSQNRVIGILAAISIATNFIVNAIKENTEAIRDLPVRDDDEDY